jgi:hypothetical protein
MFLYPKFAILALHPKTGHIKLMGYVETAEQAIDLQQRATLAGWVMATICGQPADLDELSK